MEYGEPVMLDVLPTVPTEYPTIDDLVGEPRKFADNITNSIDNEDCYRRYGVLPDKSFFIAGNPGTGKTFSLKAINNTYNKELLLFIKSNIVTESDLEKPDNYKLCLVSYDIGKYGTAYINRGSRIIQNFFDQAFNYTYSCPVIIQIDEADAILASRSMVNHSEDRKNLETLMKNLQIANDLPNCYIVMLTNEKSYVDEAVKRAGRVDKHYEFPPPDFDTRKALFKKIIDNRNTKAGYAIIRNYDLNKLATQSEYFTHADIANTIDASVRVKVQELIERKKQVKADIHGFITQKTLEQQIRDHKVNFNKDETSLDKYIL